MSSSAPPDPLPSAVVTVGHGPASPSIALRQMARVAKKKLREREEEKIEMIQPQ